MLVHCTALDGGSFRRRLAPSPRDLESLPALMQAVKHGRRPSLGFP
jgi:hypothetical protein